MPIHNKDEKVTSLEVNSDHQTAIKCEGGMQFFRERYPSKVSLTQAANNQQAKLKGVPVGGLYRNENNLIYIATKDDPTSVLNTDVRGTLYGTVIGETPYNPGYLYGLNLKYNNPSQITVTQGSCRDQHNQFNLNLNHTSITLDFNHNGVNGLDSDKLESNTWYAIFLIGGVNQSTAAIASKYHPHNSIPILPPGYDHFRRIGWVRSDVNSEITPFIQMNNNNTKTYYWDKEWLDGQLFIVINGSATNYTPLDLSGSVPPTSCEAYLQMNYHGNSDSIHVNTLYFRPTGSFQQNKTFSLNSFDLNNNNHMHDSNQILVLTNENQQIDYALNNKEGQLNLFTVGFVDNL